MGDGWVGRRGGKVRSQGGIVEGDLRDWLLTGRIFLLVGGFSPTGPEKGLAWAVMLVAKLTTSGTVECASSPRASPTDVGLGCQGPWS